MRKLAVMLSLLLAATEGMAQTNDNGFTTINWQSVADIAAKTPDSIHSIVKAMTCGDTTRTISLEEAFLGYAGQTYFTDNKRLEILLANAHDTADAGNADSAVVMYRRALELNPLCLGALYNVTMLMFRSIEDNASGGVRYTVDEVNQYAARAAKLLRLIESTGNGTEEHPFAVTRVEDEYLLMNVILKIKTSAQYLVTKTKPPCDVFDVGKTSEAYHRDKIHFDITRVLEIEKELFE